MEDNRKYKIIEIVAVVFCFAGCSLLLAQKFIETDYNLFDISLALNGIGIAAFLYSRNKK